MLQLPVDAAQVELDRLVREEERGAHLAVRHPARHVERDLELLRRQLLLLPRLAAAKRLAARAQLGARPARPRPRRPGPRRSRARAGAARGRRAGGRRAAAARRTRAGCGRATSGRPSARGTRRPPRSAARTRRPSRAAPRARVAVARPTGLCGSSDASKSASAACGLCVPRAGMHLGQLGGRDDPARVDPELVERPGGGVELAHGVVEVVEADRRADPSECPQPHPVADEAGLLERPPAPPPRSRGTRDSAPRRAVIAVRTSSDCIRGSHRSSSRASASASEAAA